MTERGSYTFSVDARECQICEHYSECKNKRRTMCAYLEPMTAPGAAMSAESAAASMLVPHEYRKVKLGENTTVTIDLVELKKKAEDAIYSALGCGFLGGAT